VPPTATEATPPATSSAVPPAQPPALSLLPDIAEEPDATAPYYEANTQYEINTPTLNVNPLFDADQDQPSQTTTTPAPAILSPSNIPSAPAPPHPRRSERSNRGVPADTYGRYVSGLPGAKRKAHRSVSFLL
jgi:hypothetical protein